jgi:hypothetical protein
LRVSPGFAQGLILADNSYRCAEGAPYFRESRERVRCCISAIGWGATG